MISVLDAGDHPLISWNSLPINHIKSHYFFILHEFLFRTCKWEHFGLHPFNLWRYFGCLVFVATRKIQSKVSFISDTRLKRFERVILSTRGCFGSLKLYVFICLFPIFWLRLWITLPCQFISYDSPRRPLPSFKSDRVSNLKILNCSQFCY